MGPVASVFRYFRGTGDTMDDPEAKYPNGNEFMGYATTTEEEINQLLLDGQDLKKMQEEWEEKVFEHQMRLRERGSERNRRLLQWLTLRKRKSSATQEMLYQAFSHYKTLEKSVNDLEEAFRNTCDQVIVDMNDEIDDDYMNQFSTNTSADSEIISPTSSYSNYVSSSEEPGTSTGLVFRDVAEDTENVRENLVSDKREKSGSHVSKRKNLESSKCRSKRGNAAKAPHGLDKEKTDEKNGKFACICGVVCSSVKAHKRHVEYKTKIGSFPCRHCSKCYFYFGHLTQHERQSHNVVNKKQLSREFGCRKCGLVLFTLADLICHQKLAHSNWASPSESDLGPRNVFRAPTERPRSVNSIKRNKRKMSNDKLRWTAGTLKRGKQPENTSAGSMQDGEVGTSTC